MKKDDQAKLFVQETASAVQPATENGTISHIKIEEKKTKWASIWLASVILFLVAVQFSIYLSSLWPYLSQVKVVVFFKISFRYGIT